MKSIINAKFCVPVILILIGLSCVAYATWSWAGATAWCWHYVEEDQETGEVYDYVDSHASVGWGGMADGSWSASATAGSGTCSTHGSVSNSGGGTADSEAKAKTGYAGSSICGTGNDGQSYSDGASDSYPR